MSTSRTKTRNPHIDTLRGLCILAVIFLHINIRLPLAQIPLSKHLPHWVLSTLGWSGYYGVIVFFVISGFLITNLSLERWGKPSAIQATQFYQLRFARIMPCLIMLLLILATLDLFAVHGYIINQSRSSLGEALFSALTFHVNWLEAKHGYLPASWDVLWSLSIEEMFYLFFPLLLRLLRNRRHLSYLLIVFVILGPLARSLFSHNAIWQDKSYLSCMDGMAFGCLAALYKDELIQLGRPLLWTGMALAIFIIACKHITYSIGLSSSGLSVTLLELAVAAILLGVSSNTANKKPGPFAFIGRYSYEIYLSHMFVVLGVVALFKQFNLSGSAILLAYLLSVIFAVTLGFLWAKLFSEPMNLWLRRYISHRV